MGTFWATRQLQEVSPASRNNYAVCMSHALSHHYVAIITIASLTPLQSQKLQVEMVEPELSCEVKWVLPGRVGLQESPSGRFSYSCTVWVCNV